jgi:hypothetical protein
MDSHDGQGRPDSALILNGIQALHDRLDELERRIAPAGDSVPALVPAWKRPTDREARWQAAVAVAAAVALQYLLPGRLVLLRPVWLLPTLQVLLLIALVIAGPRRFSTTESRVIRWLSLALTALISLANAWSVARLLVGLVQGTAGSNAGPLFATSQLACPFSLIS